MKQSKNAGEQDNQAKTIVLTVAQKTFKHTNTEIITKS